MLAPVIIFALFSCDSGGKAYISPFGEAPDALAAYDESSGGV